MEAYSIHLGPKLFDLLQHCELRCTAQCCGWDAFDFSENWISRWRQLREEAYITAAVLEMDEAELQLSSMPENATVEIKRYFNTLAADFGKHLSQLKMLLS